ncbi:hypothetical protein [Cognatishimia activa]|uniref:Uncharacterized protein n=1 Tax=Cognatishimia activa TaxID=1715691 RepID=A0A0P1ISJ3_9RHOB|nr:hypothetical protein [Cognatishimia activa]CUI68264.1 hypothetical protein TA5113_01139 [Cognatishimia activa]CUK26500.1 hypothetical protein TA5114_02312 [Cognatishimia activa]
MGPKIATCCYCGTRAVFKLSGDVQHELACSSCGAPLHEIKQMPLRSPAQTQKVEKKQHYEQPRSYKKSPKKKEKYKKKKKGFLSELFDDFDDILDIFD